MKRAGDNCVLDWLYTMMAVMTTVKKVYILLWKNLIIKVWICLLVDCVDLLYNNNNNVYASETALADVHP